MLNTKKLLLIIWIIVVGIILLFSRAVLSEPLISEVNGVVTMSAETFKSMADTLEVQQKLLSRANTVINELEGRNEAIDSCIREAVKNETAVLPCLNVDPTDAFSPTDHQRFLKNTTEF